MTKKVDVDVLAVSVVRVREMSHFKVNSELVGGRESGCCGTRAPARACLVLTLLSLLVQTYKY